MAKIKYQGITYDLPNVTLYRGGKYAPVWKPSPTLRRQGWKAKSFKGTDGHWLPMGEMIQAARDHIQAVENWRTGTAKPPADAVHAAPPRYIAGTFDDLFHRFLTDRKHRERRRTRTRENYRYSIRYLSPILGRDPITALTPKKARALYEKIVASKSVSVANSHMEKLGTILKYAVSEELIEINPLAGLDKDQLPARPRFWTNDEALAMVTAADDMGLHSIGDMIICGINTGQRRADLLRFPITFAAADKYVYRQRKTRRYATDGRRVTIPTDIMDDIRPRMLDAAKRAERIVGAIPAYLFISEATAKPYLGSESHFNKKFRQVKARAALTCPTVNGDPEQDGLDLKFKHLRDTALTRMVMSGGDIPQICSIIGHKEEYALKVWQHYLVYRPEIAEEGGRKLTEWKRKYGIVV